MLNLLPVCLTLKCLKCVSDRRKSEKSKTSEDWETKVIDFLLKELQTPNIYILLSKPSTLSSVIII